MAGELLQGLRPLIRRLFPAHAPKPVRPQPQRQMNYAAEEGWRDVGGKRLEGYFRAVGLRWKGEVHASPAPPRFYIQNPPIESIRSKTQHGGCFHPTDRRGWWLMNIYDREGIPVSDASSGIAATNALLNRLFQSGR